MNTSKQTVTGVELINAIKNIVKMLDETPERITQEEMIEISDAIQKIEQIENKKKAEAEKIGTCDDCAGYFDAGKDTCKTCDFDLNSYNKPEEEDETDEKEAEFTCDTCDCELDSNDLINGYHDQSVYQCADCFDNDQSEDEKEIDEEDDIFCGGCGFTPCVEPEDPMDMRLCERCYKDSIAE